MNNDITRTEVSGETLYKNEFTVNNIEIERFGIDSIKKSVIMDLLSKLSINELEKIVNITKEDVYRESVIFTAKITI